MVIIHSLMKVDNKLVPIEEFEGPVVDEDYIEGAIELTINGKIILRREMIDYVDQLWAYLVDGMGQIVAGEEFSTGYPDMPIDIVLRPQGRVVAIALSSKSHRWDADASVEVKELLGSLIPAGIHFFKHLQRFVPSHQAMYDRYIVDLSQLVIPA